LKRLVLQVILIQTQLLSFKKTPPSFLEVFRPLSFEQSSLSAYIVSLTARLSLLQ